MIKVNILIVKSLKKNTVNMRIGENFYKKQLHFLVIVVIITDHIIMDWIKHFYSVKIFFQLEVHSQRLCIIMLRKTFHTTLE